MCTSSSTLAAYDLRLGAVSIGTGLAKCKSFGSWGERGGTVVSYGMSPGLRRLAGALVAALVSPVSGFAQAPLTATDSPILASQPPKRLALAPSRLPQPARSAHRGGGLDSICRRERRPNRAADHLLVAKGAGRGEPARQVPATLPAAVVFLYCTALTISKIGKYIATTMPPTITPSTTIMTGSMSDSSALTAASTSSS